ncbi:hypothetical protein D3C86_1572890 [compost metagenome]
MVARIVDRRDDPDLERAQMRLFVSPLEPADPLVDHRQQVGDAVGHRRVGGDRAFFRLAPYEAGFATALEGFLGVGNDVAQDVELFGHGGAAAEDDLGKLLQPEEPEGKIQRVGVDDHRKLREGGGELVVRVEDQDAQLRIGGNRLVEQQRHGGRLADARGADDGEMLG